MHSDAVLLWQLQLSSRVPPLLACMPARAVPLCHIRTVGLAQCSRQSARFVEALLQFVCRRPLIVFPCFVGKLSCSFLCNNNETVCMVAFYQYCTLNYVVFVLSHTVTSCDSLVG